MPGAHLIHCMSMPQIQLVETTVCERMPHGSKGCGITTFSKRNKVALEMRDGTTWVFDKRLISKSDKCRVLLQTTGQSVVTFASANRNLGRLQVEEKGNFDHVHLKSLVDVKVKVLHVGFVLKRQISATLDLDINS